MFEQNIVVEGCTVVADAPPLSASQKEEAKRRIMEYPLPHVVYRLKTERRIVSEDIDIAVEEWRKFMVTALFADSSIGMISPIVDEVWHANILFTKEYAKFCQECSEIS